MRTSLELMIRAGKSYGRDSCAIFAGGITYYALLSLFPLMLFALSIAGYVYQDADEQRELVDNLLDNLPLDAGSGRDDVENLISSVVQSRGTLGIIALVGAAYSGSALFGAVRTSLNAVYHAQKKRPFWLAKGLDLLLVICFTVLLVVSVALTVGISLAQRFSEDIFGQEASWLVDRLLAVAWALVPTAVSTGVFYLLFRYVPARRVEPRHALWGAIVSAVLFEILKFGFTAYVNNFSNYNATYGAIGFVVILLVFFNFSSQVLLLGAEVARSGAEMDEDGPQRFRETEALAAKLRAVERRAPIVGALVPGEPIRSESLWADPLRVEDYLAAAPLTTVVAGGATARQPAVIVSAFDARPARSHNGRQGALASLLVLGAFVTLAFGFRKR